MPKKHLINPDEDQSFIERRKSDRIIIVAPLEMVVLATPNEEIIKRGEVIKGFTRNISSGGLLEDAVNQDHGPGGLLAEVNTETPVGTTVKILMNIPLPGYTSTFVLEGEVLRCNPSKEDSEKFELALQFKRITAHHFNNIKLGTVKNMLGL